LNTDPRNAAILIVDDQQVNVELLEALLADEGYTNVHSTTDPRQALPLFDALSPDLILLDLHMPHLDGFAVLERLGARIPAGAYVPILVLTADISAQAKHRALSGGARDFLSKPFDVDEVAARIRNLLQTRLLHLQLEQRNRALAEAMRDLDAKRALSERLLLNVLPRPIADRLKQEEQTIIADTFPEVTVLFADIADFTPMAARLPPEEVVAWLNDVFSALDCLAERHGLEKIKTIGDCYMMVSGLPTPRPDHAEAAADLALAVRDEMAGRVTAHGEPLLMRIGIHTGPVVAGVIGTTKFAYDLWGDTVNLASRMESQGVGGAIQVTEATYQRLRYRYRFEERGAMEIRGKGVMQTYLLIDRLT
jgi:class 3 adenylate cyclase